MNNVADETDGYSATSTNPPLSPPLPPTLPFSSPLWSIILWHGAVHDLRNALGEERKGRGRVGGGMRPPIGPGAARVQEYRATAHSRALASAALPPHWEPLHSVLLRQSTLSEKPYPPYQKNRSSICLVRRNNEGALAPRITRLSCVSAFGTSGRSIS